MTIGCGARSPLSDLDAYSPPPDDASRSDAIADACDGASCLRPVHIYAGAAHACALRSDGRLRCWGMNDNGEVGDGTTTDRAAPTLVPALDRVVTVALGVAFGCAQRDDRAVWCWGRNADGQLGDGTTTGGAPRRIASLATNTREISTGDSFACARDDA